MGSSGRTTLRTLLWTRVTQVVPAEMAVDRAWLGMRTSDGVGESDLPSDVTEWLVAQGLADRRDGRICPTLRGFLMADRIAAMAALAAVSPFVTYFARETRMYSLVVVLSLLVAWSFVEAFVRPQGIDQPSAPLFADAIEQAASLGPVARRAHSRSPRRGIVLPSRRSRATLSKV